MGRSRRVRRGRDTGAVELKGEERERERERKKEG